MGQAFRATQQWTLSDRDAGRRLCAPRCIISRRWTQIGASGDGKAVVEEMKKLPTDDPLFGKGTVRADGRKLHNMYLFEVQEAGRVEISLGLLQAGQDHPAERKPGVRSEEGGCDFLKS